MRKFIEWLTVKRLLIISLIGVIGFLSLIPKEVLFTICDNHNSGCINVVGYFVLVFMIGATVLIPSIISFFLKERIFNSWKKTLFIYLFIYLFILIFIPWNGGDAFLRIQKDLIAMGASVVYSVFSIILIIYQSLKKE